MRFTREAGRYQLVPLTFVQDALAASQSNVQLSAAEEQQLCKGYIMPFAGEIVAQSWKLDTAGTAGNLSIGPTIGGTEVSDPTAAVTTAASGYDACNRGTNRFVAGAEIGCEITTDGSWNGTTSDLIVQVWVLLEITGV